MKSWKADEQTKTSRGSSTQLLIDPRSPHKKYQLPSFVQLKKEKKKYFLPRNIWFKRVFFVFSPLFAALFIYPRLLTPVYRLLVGWSLTHTWPLLGSVLEERSICCISAKRTRFTNINSDLHRGKTIKTQLSKRYVIISYTLLAIAAISHVKRVMRIHT